MDDLTGASQPSEPSAISTETQDVTNNVSESIDLDSAWQQVKDYQPQTETQPESQAEVVEPTAPKAETQATESAVEQEEEPDLLSEFDNNRIPTREELVKETRGMGKEAREAYLNRMDELRTARDLTTKLGGENALPVLEQVANTLFTPTVTPESTGTFLETLGQTNPNLLLQSTEMMFDEVWQQNAPMWQNLVNRQLQAEFGEGMTREKIAEMSNWLKLGLFDEDSLRLEVAEGFKNPMVEHLLGKVETLTQQNEQEKRQEAIQAQAQAEYVRQLQENSDKFIYETVQQEISPIIEKLAWAKNESDPEDWGSAKEIFGQMRESWIKDQIYNSPEAANIKFLIEKHQAFDNRNQPTPPYLAQLDRIKGKVKGMMLQAGRKLAPTLTKSLLSTRNAQISQPQPTVQQSNASKNTVPTQQVQQQPQGNPNAQEPVDLDALWKQVQNTAQQYGGIQRQMTTGRR